MKKNPLFPRVNGILHGGDYNPEQWLDRPDILEEDVRLMKKAGINCVTLGVFSWAVYEPTEGEFHFDWIEKIIDNLYDNGIYTVLATPSGARPAWLDAKYPEAMRCDENGNRYHHGIRHNHCMSSPAYRKKVAIIDSQLGKRFANHPAVLLWHISNEFGGECYCDLCKSKFQNWLKERYHNNIDELNHAWWTTFWSHRYTSFDQIDPPYKNGEQCVMGQNLDWKRFTTFNTTDFMNHEIQTLKAFNPDIPFTTNYMDTFWGLDYHEMSKNIDYISWDSYPQMHNDFESITDNFLYTAFNHALFRSMKPGQPFMLMESAPGVTNWQRVNKVRRPGFHKLSSLQALAAGSDTVQYFQIRKSRGSSEQYHGAVIDHMGTDETRIFKEVAELGGILKDLNEIAGTCSDNKVALIWDWDSRWAVSDAWALANETKKWEATILDFWKELMHLGIDADIISSDMDFSSYRVIIAPMLYVLHDDLGDKIKTFVNQGGHFVSTYFSGYVDKSTLCYLGGFPGQGLSDLFGLVAEEIDTLYPTDRNSIKFTNGTKVEVFEYQELLRIKDASILASYCDDYVKDTPAVTKKQFGQGYAYYIACRTKASDLQFFLKDILLAADVKTRDISRSIEYHVRYSETDSYEFFINPSSESIVIDNVCGFDLISSTAINNTLNMEPESIAIIRKALCLQ